MFDTRAMSLLERTLDAYTLRQKVIANNIANVDTPGFKRSEVQFEQFLQRELDGRSGKSKSITGYRTDPRHFHIGSSSDGSKGSTAKIFTENSTSFNHNNNNVDIEYEMAMLAQNQLKYNLIIDRTNGFFKSMRTAIDRR